MKIGQPWKAASLDGWQLHHDPNYYNKTMAGKQDTRTFTSSSILSLHLSLQASDERTVKLPCGNKFRDVWKLTAWEMSKEVCLSVCRLMDSFHLIIFFLYSPDLMRMRELFMQRSVGTLSRSTITSILPLPHPPVCHLHVRHTNLSPFPSDPARLSDMV